MEIRLAKPADANAITRTIKSCYGATYVEHEATRPARLRRQLRSGRVRYALAEAEGRIVGQIALEDLGHGLFLHCRAVVTPDFRGRGLMGALSQPLFELARQGGAQLVLGSSVTQHVATQRFNVRAGFRPLGLLLGIYPGIRPEGVRESSQAVSGLLTGLPLEPFAGPCRLQVPGWLRPRVEEVLEQLSLPVAGAPRRAQAPISLQGVERHEAIGRVHFRFGAGPGPAAESWRWQEDAEARVQWADVPLEHRDAPELIEELVSAGLHFGAVIPLAGPGGEHVLRLQRCTEPLRPEPIQVLPAFAELRDQVVAEHRRAQPALPLCEAVAQ